MLSFVASWTVLSKAALIRDVDGGGGPSTSLDTYCVPKIRTNFCGLIPNKFAHNILYLNISILLTDFTISPTDNFNL